MEVLTTEQRMEILMDSPKLPVGQMCRKLQYPTVTAKELEARFAVKALADKYNGMEAARILAELAEKNSLPIEEVRRRVRVDLETGTFQDTESEDQWARMRQDMYDAMLSYRAYFADEQWASGAARWAQERGITKQAAESKKAIRGTIKAKFCKGLVKIESLDAYMGDEIPARVLESLEVAREAGLTDFHVAYPVIEVKDVEVRQEQQKDPVLLAKLGDRYLEIDMWE